MFYKIQAVVNKEAEKGTYLHVLIPDEFISRDIRRYAIADVISGELRIDDARKISADQRKKIYATLNDIANYTGDVLERMKECMKYDFMIATGEDYFSLSKCDMTTARLFISFMLDFALEWRIPLTESLIDRCDDITATIYSSLMHRRCIICGRDGELHHWDALGMGQDRATYDDSKHRKLCLCREHHNEAHRIGIQSFEKKYHVYGITFNENTKSI